ncbi:hypothetical protein Tco_0968300 [Tanacetum coccineum]
MDGCTKGPQLEEGENLNTKVPRTRRTPPRGPSALAGQTHGGPSPVFVKENIDVLRTMIKELDNRAEEVGGYFPDRSYRSKVPRKSSSNQGYDHRVAVGSEDLSMPYRRLKLMPFTSRITRFRYHRWAKLPPNVHVYEGNKDLEDYLSIFSAAAEQEEWPMPEEFSQQKMYDKEPTEIHGIKRNLNEGLQAFMDRFKAESVHIKGVPPVLRISAFMHWHGHPELAKKLNDKIPKTVDEMWERVRAFIRGETAADTTEAIRREGFTPLTKTLKEILAMDNVNFPPPPPMTEEAVALGRLAHLVKDIRQGGQKGNGLGKGKEKVINMVRSQGYRKRPYERVKVKRIHIDGGSSLEVMHEHCFRNLSYWTRSRLKESRVPLMGFSGEVIYPLGVIDLEVTIGECGKTRTVIMEFTVVKSPSPYNALLDPTLMQTSSEAVNPRVLLASVETHPRRLGKEPMQLDDMEEKRQLDKGRKPPKFGVKEKTVVNDNYPEQLVTIGGGLSAECRHALIHTLRKNVNIFAWTPADMTGIPRAITEHSLDTYPHIDPKTQKKRSLAPDRRKVVTDEVNEWLKADIVRRVRYLTWVANSVLVKKVDGS